MSDWTPDTAERFTQLRLQEMSGRLSPTDQAELTQLRAAVAAEEDAVIAPALDRLAAEQQELETLLTTTQANNQQLQRLINQQSFLIADVRRLLSRFVYQESEKGLGSMIVEQFSTIGGVELEIPPRSPMRPAPQFGVEDA